MDTEKQRGSSEMKVLLAFPSDWPLCATFMDRHISGGSNENLTRSHEEISV